MSRMRGQKHKAQKTLRAAGRRRRKTKKPPYRGIIGGRGGVHEQ